MEANITDSYEYRLEMAKHSFHQNLSSLIDLRSYLRDKVSRARNNDSIFFNSHEMSTIDEWLASVHTEIAGDYKIINRMNRAVSSNNSVLRELAHGRTPKLKDLLNHE